MTTPGLVSIVIPVYNERVTIEIVVRRVLELPLAKEVLVVDDGSVDGTREVVARFEGERGVRVILAEHRGKGMAFRLGLEQARGEVVVIQDADLEYNPADIPRVIAPILSGAAEVCYGSRIRGHNPGRSSFAFYWGGRLLSLWTTLLYGVHVTDEATGYKAFRTLTVRAIPLEAEGFDLEPELTAKVLRKRLRYCEVPISYNPRRIEEGKKITWRDGLRAIWTLLAWRFRSIT